MNRLTFRSLITVLVLFVLFCVPSIALADGITWDLSGVTFDDGGTASGSFVYDALTNTYSAIDITTSPSPTLPFAGATYTGLSPVFGPSSTGMLLGTSGNLTNTALLYLLFGADLTDSGGTVPLLTGVDGGAEGTCNNTDCSDSTALRSMTAGEVIGTVATPEPSALSLLGIGLIALLAGAAIRKLSHA
jgi:PEP-CTERM motif